MKEKDPSQLEKDDWAWNVEVLKDNLQLEQSCNPLDLWLWRRVIESVLCDLGGRYAMK